MSDKINEFLESIPDGRCKGCRYAKTVFATNQYMFLDMFLGCYCVPYRGKRFAEILNCPKIKNTEVK